VTDDECIEEAEEAAKVDEKRGPLQVNVNIEIDFAGILCAILFPPALVAIALAVL